MAMKYLVDNPKVMFCGVVCGFRVRVWESCRVSRGFGYGYEASVAELPELPGIIVARAYITRGSSGRVQKVL